ncbi:hypothetical protein Har1130_05195 [Haloarcula sp. CBA1130]|uniref:DUF7266 family protein n=1 Tax=unclassified Haloarcula TaxID=2624677 RepID=UPI001243C2B9|nr:MULTISPECIES: hypothetical protein [unclassified Haloarcula]KAA9398149.1 hypothetical protein Har1129_07945 [Haloarcula sp. CBA1129]KAA9402164.1 hypothetical protein Har1130_05195 [Haloarcula sp. CBA1130]
MRESRAVSTPLGYALTLAITAILVTGLLIAGTGFVEERQESVIREELSVIGQQVAADFARVDRLVVAADSSGASLTATTRQTFPERVSGSNYRLSLDPGTERLVLTSTEPEVRVTVSVTNRTSLQESTVDGGIVEVAYNGSSKALEVNDG